MRNIVNISLPDNMMGVVKKEMESGYYASTSEFFRHLLRLWEARQLGEELKKGRKKFEKGEGKILKSLKDLE